MKVSGSADRYLMVRTAPSLFISTMAAIFMLSGLAQTSIAAQGPQSFTLDGQITSASTNNPLLDTNAKLEVYVLDPTKNCILYAEEQFVDTVTSDGYFNIQVGSDTVSAKRIAGRDPGLAMARVFENTSTKTAVSYPGFTCAGGTYTPAAQAVRYFRIVVTPSATGTPDTMSPDAVLDAVPMAMIAEQAESIQGFQASDLLKVNTSGVSLSQANLESVFTGVAWTNIQAVMAGSFTPATSTGGTTLPNYPTASPPATPTAGSIWYDSDTNQVKYYDGTATQSVGTSTGSLSNVSVSANLTVNGTPSATIASSSTIDLNNTGVTAGTYPKVTVDAKGRVTGGASLLEADIPTLSTAGKVSGGAINAGTIGGSTSISSTGTISAAGISSRQLDIYDSDNTNFVRLQTPATGVLTSDYTLTLPDNDGATSGQVLTTDGSGALSWTTPLTTSEAFVNGGNSFGAAATLGTNDTFGLNFETDDTTRMVIDATGNVGIGKANPARALDVVGGFASWTNPHSQTTNYNPNSFYSFYNGTTNNTGTITGIYNGVNTQNIRSNNVLRVISNELSLSNTGGNNEVSVSYNYANIGSASGTTNSAFGVRSEIVKSNAGTLTNAYGLYSDINLTGSNLTNAYGLYIDSLAGTNRWGVYQSASADPNYFAGNVGIGLGTASPSAVLQLKAGTAAAGTAPLKLTAGTNLTTPEPGAIEFDGTNLFYTDNTNTRQTIGTGSGSYSSGSTINAGAGTVGAPSLSFSTDANTGFYSAAADTIGVSVGGLDVFDFDSVGLASTSTGGGVVTAASGTASAPVFSFAGDEDTGWYSPAADTLAASTAGSERIRINSAGNVGIGTASPTSALHIAGNRSAPAWLSAGPGLRLQSATYTDTTSSGSVSNPTAAHSIGIPTFAASNATTYSRPTTLLIDGAPTAGANVTFSGDTNYAFRVNSGLSAFMSPVTIGTDGGAGIAARTALLNVGGAYTLPAGTFNDGFYLNIGSGGTSTVTNAASSGTVPISSIVRINPATIAATNATTFTNAATLTIGGAPSAGANVTITNSQALNVTSGTAFFGGNVGIGTVAPRSVADIGSGTLLLKPSTANATATVNFLNGNIQHTANDCGAFDLHHMKDGGSYTFIVKGTTSATCVFTAFSDAGVTGLTVHMPTDHAATIVGTHTVYSLLVSEADVYVTWLPGM